MIGIKRLSLACEIRPLFVVFVVSGSSVRKYLQNLQVKWMNIDNCVN